MRVIGLAGWSGAGKTTLLAALIPWLKARGLTVSTIKHAITASTWTGPARTATRTARRAPPRSWSPPRSDGP